MPTLHEPQLTEVSSVWREPSVQMARELAANKEVVLGKLRFYCEHGRPEDWEGKFAKQVLAHEEEVLSEIVGILTLAASLAVMLSPGVVIATLQRVLIEPALIFQSTFPSEVAWILADFYQRNKETPGTFWPDIMGERPHNFPGRERKPTRKRIKAAATSALDSFRKDRIPGRPPNVASVVLAQKLGDLFRRYNSKITRHSLDSARADNRPHQIDGGPFFEFAEAVLKPLQVYLRANRLPSVSASTVARQGVKAQKIKITRKTFGTLFHP